MELELRHLRLIVTVAEQGSVTRAATALGLTQPALTAQLNRIDRTFGATVFTRDQRGARPTALGEFVLGRAKVLLPAMAALVEDAHRIVAGTDVRTRSVRVGTAEHRAGGRFVNRLISAARRRGDERGRCPTSTGSTDQVATGAPDLASSGCAGTPSHRGGRGPVVAGEHRPGVPPGAGRPSARCACRRDARRLADAEWFGVTGAGCFQRCFVTACARRGSRRSR